MKFAKLLALFLAVLMLASTVLVACSKDKEDEGEGGVNVIQETEDNGMKYDAEIHNLHGHEFWFLVRDAAAHAHLDTNEIYAEELNGEKLNDAVFKRNSALEEKYSCKIFEERNADPATAVREQLIAGEYQYDYIYTSVRTLRSLSASNLLVDFYELESIDLNKGWWDMNCIEGLSIAGKAYYAMGAAGTLDERSAWIIYWNRDNVEKAELENPYDLVDKGEWTIDKMYEYMVATVEDRDGDGVMTQGVDNYGYIGEQLNNWMHVAACNVKLSRMSSDGEIEIPPTVNKELLAVWDELRPLLTSEYRNIRDTGFSAGGATFYGCNAGVLLNMANKTINWGVLPMPKRNAEQEEYWTSINSGWCYGFSIPTNTDYATDYEENGFTSGREQAAYFLEAFSYHSVGTVEMAFFDQVLKRQVVKDSRAADMIEIGLKNKVYDPVVLFNFGNIGTSLFNMAGGGAGVDGHGTDVNYDTLVSTYESRVEAARKQLRNYVNYITAED